MKLKSLLIASAVFVGFAAAPAAAAPVLFAGNGHYYEFVNTLVSFDAALAGAASQSYAGNQGYLATVTSAAEQRFIYDNVTTLATWFAGTDRATEGEWKWVAGPEAGTTFFVGTGTNGTTLTYSNWSAFEPNNAGDEDFLWGNWNGTEWNDIFAYELGYVVEYGVAPSVPEPTTWAMMLLGVGAIGGAMRRRRAVATRVRFA